MVTRAPTDPVAVAVLQAIRRGDVVVLRQLLSRHADLATAWIGDDRAARSLLHVVTDWPGHFPAGPDTVRELIAAGADVNTRFRGPHAETPLHWAASSDDVAVLDALLDAGAEIDATGAVIAAGTPLDDATAFGRWDAARRLVERGARVNGFAAASLGLMGELHDFYGAATPVEQLSDAFWAACHGGQRAAAEYLLGCGADLDRQPGWDALTPLDAAARSDAREVVTWLHRHGAHTAAGLRK